ncbi:hypothetical protein TruAng_008559 [Truncatella angustata]|nr:hypothetical protein TruAng_008559 [Truncatella angustata]
MASAAQLAPRFNVFNDTSFSSDCESDQSAVDLGSNTFVPLRSISASNTQNRQASGPQPGSCEASSPVVESLTADLEKLHLRESQESELFKGKPVPNLKALSQPGSRLTRLSIPHNIFEVLETVPEDDCQEPSTSAAVSVSNDSQHYIEVPATAAQHLPSAEEQLAKHRKGNYEWVLTVRVPKQPSSDDTGFPPPASKELCNTIKLCFGCNLLPSKTHPKADQDSTQGSYTLLVTPLRSNAELDAATQLTDKERNMALTMDMAKPATPSKSLPVYSEVVVGDVSPKSTISAEADSFVETITSRPLVEPMVGIENPIEALDKLEEQLEEFDMAASMGDLATHNVARPSVKSLVKPLSSDTCEDRRATPKSVKTAPKIGVSTLRIRPIEPKRSPNSRRSASMIFMDPPKLLDSPKLKMEDKALVQAPPKKAARKELTSLLPPKQPVKSTKLPTVPAFELPGEAVARRLKEKREARLSMAAGTKKPEARTIPTVNRSKSTKRLARPTFELPGEAISRRKREEQQAKLRAQEEEERRRREFKARPVRAGGIPSSVPRDTATSRARQAKGPLSGKANLSSPSPNKRISTVAPRGPTTGASHNSQSRGRLLTTESSQLSRATSSSTGSISGKRSSVSFEDTQAQRLRGKEILRRDSMYGQDRQREKREREALARLAREEAAERSRQKSREWAEKQKQKRMTVGSLRDVVAISS